MADSNSAGALLAVVIGALGLAISPDQMAVGLAMGMLGSYLIRAMSPKDNRAEVWLIPFAAVFVGIFGVMFQPHLPYEVPGWHPSLVMAVAGAFSVPLLRAMQVAGAMFPQVVRWFGKSKMETGRDE